MVWSDGCFAQFKCARAWYFVARYPRLTVCEERLEGVNMCWNYFASGHGKGEVDNACALLKCKIRKEQMKSQAHKLQNAHDVENFCQEQYDMLVYI